MKVVTIVNGIPRLQNDSLSAATYSADLEITTTISAGTAVTLPSSETYSDVELNVYLNGSHLSLVYDYIYEGSIPRTQVSFTFDLYNGDKLTFRKEHD